MSRLGSPALAGIAFPRKFTLAGDFFCVMVDSNRGEFTMSDIQKSLEATVLKVDDSIGAVMGWAIISKIDGKPYVDSQNDHIPESTVLKSAAKFMQGKRVGKVQHTGGQAGEVTLFPLTTDIAKALGIQTQKTGLLAWFTPSDPAILQKYRDGELTGFSIGGKAIQTEIKNIP